MRLSSLYLQYPHPVRLFIVLMAMMMSTIAGCSVFPGDREGAGKGRMRVVGESGLVDAFSDQAGLFSRYYPEAEIDIEPMPSNKIVPAIASGTVRAAVIGAGLSPSEAMLLESRGRNVRLEPVAKDAVVCIVGKDSPMREVSLDALAGLLFQGAMPSALPSKPVVEQDCFRLALALGLLLGRDPEQFHAYGVAGRDALVRYIASDRAAMGILFRSAFESMKQSGSLDGVRLVPVIADDGGSPIAPTQGNIFAERYPLVTSVLYLYPVGEPLPSGFGAWLAAEGQKSFDGGLLVPWKHTVRTIILQEQQ